VRLQFAYDGGGLAKGGSLRLLVDGEPVGDGRLERTEPFPFSVDETFDIGFESGSPVCRDYSRNRFNGSVNWVRIEVGDDIPEEHHRQRQQQRLSLALATH
jgi:arylsulfatase